MNFGLLFPSDFVCKAVKVCKWAFVRYQCCLQGIIRDGPVLQTSRSSRNIRFTSGDKRDQGGPGRAGPSEDEDVNVRWEVSDCLYKEKAPRLKEIFVANSPKTARYARGTEGSAAGTTFGDVCGDKAVETKVKMFVSIVHLP